LKTLNTIIPQRLTIICLTIVSGLLLYSEAKAQQTPSRNPFKIGDKVQGNLQGWKTGKVVKVLKGGQMYEVELNSNAGAKPTRHILPAARVRVATTIAPVGKAWMNSSSRTTSTPKANVAPKVSVASKGNKFGPPIIGKYGCTETIYNYSSGTFDYEMRGSFTLAANGTYNYPGMKSSGRHSYDAKNDLIVFKGGFFDGATATFLDQKDKLRLELPTGNERKRRWTCGLVK
jgi:hypothetical protein